MGTPRFHVQRLIGPSLRVSGHEAAHALRSRRLSAGDEVILFDGAGSEAAGRISAVARSHLDVAFENVIRRPRPVPALTLAVALPKGPRQDFLIEKCAELGTAAIVPLITERSIGSASEHKRGRWRQIAIEAAKQSGQAWIPEFPAPETLAEAMRRVPAHELAVVAATEQPCAPFALEGTTRPASILAFIGPEGGWTQDELKMLMAADCQQVSLGPNILRIETAAVAIAAVVHAVQQAER